MRYLLFVILSTAQIFIWVFLGVSGLGKRVSDGRQNSFVNLEIEDEMVYIRGGFVPDVEKGSNSEILVKPFLIDKYEVSIEKFESFVRSTGYLPQSDRPGTEVIVLEGGKMKSVKGVNWECDETGKKRKEKNYPAVYISFEDAEAYATWVGKRLPTMEEWIFVASSETDRQNRWSYIINNSWHAKNTNALKPVGLKAPNAFGIYDLYGNAAEHVIANFNRTSKLPPGLTKDNVSRSAFSSFFNDPEDLIVPIFSLRNKKGTDFFTGFRCVKNVNSDES